MEGCKWSQGVRKQSDTHHRNRDWQAPDTFAWIYRRLCCTVQGEACLSDISMRKQPHVTRNFHETSHGKSVCDGLAAVVKASCYNAVALTVAERWSVTQVTCIITASKNWVWKKKKMSVPAWVVDSADGSQHITKREFIFINAADVSRNRPEIKTLTGTRKLHSICSTGQDLALKTRNISCYCAECKQGNDCEWWICWEVAFCTIETQHPSSHRGGRYPLYKCNSYIHVYCEWLVHVHMYLLYWSQQIFPSLLLYVIAFTPLNISNCSIPHLESLKLQLWIAVFALTLVTAQESVSESADTSPRGN